MPNVPQTDFFLTSDSILSMYNTSIRIVDFTIYINRILTIYRINTHYSELRKVTIPVNKVPIQTKY